MKKYVVLTLSLLVAALCFAQPNHKTIQVVGKASVRALPEEFSFSVPLEIKDADYDACYQKLVAKVDGVNADLKKAGFGTKQVKVQDLSVRENYLWEQNKRVLQGYIGSVSVTINGTYSTQQLNNVLKVLKKNECLYTLFFNLSESQREQLRKDAIAAAVADAQSNAEQLALSAKVKLGSIIRIVYNDGMPILDELMLRNAMLGNSFEKTSADMNLSPQEISIEKYVNIDYSIE